MKKQIIAGVLTLALFGCSKQQQPSAPPTTPPPEASVSIPSQPAPPPAPEAVTPVAATPAPVPVSSTAEPLTQEADGKYASLLKAFESASPETRTLVQNAADALTAGQYADALKMLAQVAAQPDLTDAQKQAVQDATATAQSQVAAGAASDAQKKLPTMP